MQAVLLAILLAAAPVATEEPGVEKRRRQAISHYEAGVEQLATERWEEAAREFSAAVKLHPLFPMAHYGLGQARMSLRRYPEALSAFISCRDAFRGIAVQSVRDTAGAEASRIEEIQGLRDSIAILQRNARLATQNDNNIRQIEERIRQLEFKPTLPPGEETATPAFVMLSIGSAHFRMGSLADAEREYRSAVGADPKLGEAHNNLAVVCLLTGRLAEAKREVELAEKSGFRVPPGLKRDIEKRLSGQ